MEMTSAGAAPTNWVAPNFLTLLVDFDAMLLLRCFLAERALWWRKVIQVTVSMRSGATVTLLAAALIQCYATRTGDGCMPLSVHATMAECRKLASEYQKFDTRDLRVKGVPAVVSYHCVAVE